LGSWQKHWHFSADCVRFPMRSFAIRRDRPSDDDLCASCHSLAQGR
jgi:hypothetical protein